MLAPLTKARTSRRAPRQAGDMAELPPIRDRESEVERDLLGAQPRA